ncbi:MAG: NAD(P)H-binding protein [Bacteroidota bacterium]
MSRVLIVGGTGFIGRHLAAALRDAGHEVTALGRNGLDLVGDDEVVLAGRLRGQDVVVNAAGLVRDQGRNTMAAVHADGACRLFRACQTAGVKRLIHLSALGAAVDGETAYQSTKGAAEAALAQCESLDWCVLRPSVVIGRGGASTAVLNALAALPLVPRIGPGTWQVQPVHVDDVAELVVRLVEWAGDLPRRLDVVGPQPLTTDALTATLRHWLGLPPPRWLPLPEPLLWAVAVVGERVMDGPLNRDVLAMLKRGNIADPTAMVAALGRPPRGVDQALARHPAAQADRWQGRLFFVRPVLRLSLAALWIATGLLSLGLYPVTDSLRMLAELGIHGGLADVALYGGGAMDLLLGALLVLRWRPVAVGGAMLLAMLAYTGLAVGLPGEYWLHPFAPLLKNLPIAAATLAMMVLED